MGAVADLYARQQDQEKRKDRVVDALLLDAMATLRFYADAKPSDIGLDEGARARRTLETLITAIGRIA
jgi:hypothetical protein